jgi:thymidylate kinase
VILLDIDAKTSQERKKKQKQLDRYEENAAYLEKVRKGFLQLCKDKFMTNNWHKIDATKSTEEVNREILNLLQH